MILQVPLENFVEEWKHHMPSQDVYIDSRQGRTIVTAMDREKQMILYSSTSQTVEEVRIILENAGLKVLCGEWKDKILIEEQAMPSYFIGAVSYQTAGSKPGLWVDAYPAEPAPAEVLMKLYEEFQETGEMPNISFEEFMDVVKPTVVVLNPEQIKGFVEAKKE